MKYFTLTLFLISIAILTHIFYTPIIRLKLDNWLFTQCAIQQGATINEETGEIIDPSPEIIDQYNTIIKK